MVDKNSPTGKCLIIAFANMIENPHWMFCYGFVSGKDNPHYLHAWNEAAGYIEDRNGMGFVKLKNLDVKKQKEIFCVDFSNPQNRIVTPQQNYYKNVNINNENVTRLDFKELISKIHHTLQNQKNNEGVNIFSFLEDDIKD